jgi:hypothetical protein
VLKVLGRYSFSDILKLNQFKILTIETIEKYNIDIVIIFVKYYFRLFTDYFGEVQHPYIANPLQKSY